MLHLSELPHNAQAQINACKKRCMILLWFLEGNSELLLIFLLKAQGIKSFHRITRFVTKLPQRNSFFQYIMKTYFDGSHMHSYFTKRNYSQTFLPVLCAVTFLLPCHHKVNAQEGEQSDYYCA